MKSIMHAAGMQPALQRAAAASLQPHPAPQAGVMRRMEPSDPNRNTFPWGGQAGVVSTGNSLDYCQQDWDQMHASEAAVKEMEAAGIAWAAALHGMPLLALKAITDIVDGDRPAQEEFLENLAAAAKALQARARALGVYSWRRCGVGGLVV